MVSRSGTPVHWQPHVLVTYVDPGPERETSHICPVHVADPQVAVHAAAAASSSLV
jgi:hypothetical protein